MSTERQNIHSEKFIRVEFWLDIMDLHVIMDLARSRNAEVRSAARRFIISTQKVAL